MKNNVKNFQAKQNRQNSEKDQALTSKNNSVFFYQKFEDKRIRLIVFNEHTLGFIDPEFPLTVQVLHSSVLRGAIGTTMRSSYHLNSTDILRLASEKDFEDFRVHFGSFENENEYIYQK